MPKKLELKFMTPEQVHKILHKIAPKIFSNVTMNSINTGYQIYYSFARMTGYFTIHKCEDEQGLLRALVCKNIYLNSELSSTMNNMRQMKEERQALRDSVSTLFGFGEY